MNLKSRLLLVWWVLEWLWGCRHCWASLHFPGQNRRSLQGKPSGTTGNTLTLKWHSLVSNMNFWKLCLTTWSVYSQRMFSNFRSLWAIPAEKHFIIAMTKKTHMFSLDYDSWWEINQPFVCRKWRAWAMSFTTLLASNSSKCFRFWICVRMEPERGDDTRSNDGWSKKITWGKYATVKLEILPPQSFSNTK